MSGNNLHSESWLKKLGRWFSKTRKKISETRIKQKISDLEVARSKEKKVLADQRRFYERLFAKHESPVKKSLEIKSVVSPLIPPTPPPPPAPSILTPSPAPLTLSIPPTPPAVEDKPLVQPVDVVDKKIELTEAPSIDAPKVPSSPGFFSRLLSHPRLKSLKPGLPKDTSKEIHKELNPDARQAVENRSWQPADAIKPNLIKNQEITFFNWHEHLLVFGLSLVMCSLAISLVYVGLLIWQKERLEANRVTLINAQAIDDQIIKTEKDIREIKDFNSKLLTVSGLLDNHIYWTNYLQFLENATLKDVYLKSFSGDLTGEYVIPAVARNLDAVSLQLEVMKAYDKIKSISPETSTPNELDNTIPFTLGMSIDPLIFIK